MQQFWHKHLKKNKKWKKIVSVPFFNFLKQAAMNIQYLI